MSDDGITGGDEIGGHLDSLADRWRQAVEQQLGQEAELILAEAIKIVPIEEGQLQNSGRTATAGLEAAIGFGSGAAAPYAVRQHEDLTYTHDSGRQAKYLEVPFMAAKDQVIENLGKAAKDAL